MKSVGSMTSIFKAPNAREWAAGLVKAGLLTISTTNPSQPTYVLHPPFRIPILPSVVRRLQEAYDPRKEIGGVLAARPAISQGVRELVVTRVYIVPNASDHPERAYRPAPDERQRAVSKCLLGTSEGMRYIPIEFHSHPSERDDMAEAPYSFLREYFNLQTSEADRHNLLNN